MTKRRLDGSETVQLNWKIEEPQTGCISCSDPNHRPYRYIIAILLAFIQGTLSFTSDLPAGIQATMIRVLKLSATEYSVLFSAYSWADIIMSLVGSIAVKRYLGVRKGFVVSVTVIAVGQLTCAIGCYVGSFWVLLLGRLLIGCGNGTTISIINSFAVLWFRGKEITFVFSLFRCACRLMATLALLTPQLIYDALPPLISSPLFKLAATEMVGTLLCIAATFSAVVAVLLDKRGAKILDRASSERARLNIKSTLSFPVSFWIIALVYSLYFSIIITSLAANSPLFFVSKYGLSLHLANLANSLSFASIALLTPLIGLFIDYTGYNLIWGYAGLYSAIIPCALYAGMDGEAFIPFLAAVLFSISYSLFGTAITVTVSYVVQPHQVTTAYGTMMAMFALAKSLIGALTGVVIDYRGYFQLMLSIGLGFFAISMFIMALFASEFLVQKEYRVFNVSGRNRKLTKR